MKTCTKCGVEKSESEFGKRFDCPSGLRNQCIECHSSDIREWSKNNRDKIRGYQKRYRQCFPERFIKIRKTWEHQHPQKYAANTAVNNAVRDGRLIKQACRYCCELKVQAHHEDYSKPLEVIWLCKKHHVEADKLRREKERSPIS